MGKYARACRPTGCGLDMHKIGPVFLLQSSKEVEYMNTMRNIKQKEFQGLDFYYLYVDKMTTYLV